MAEYPLGHRTKSIDICLWWSRYILLPRDVLRVFPIVSCLLSHSTNRPVAGSYILTSEERANTRVNRHYSELVASSDLGQFAAVLDNRSQSCRAEVQK